MEGVMDAVNFDELCVTVERLVRCELERLSNLTNIYIQDTVSALLSNDIAKYITVEIQAVLRAGHSGPEVESFIVMLLSRQDTRQYQFVVNIPIFTSAAYIPSQEVIGSIRHAKHPPHPLIGIEWEPQLTLLNYPEMPIHVLYDPFRSAQDFICKYSHNDNLKSKCEVIIFVPYKYKAMVDNANIEFRTQPVKLEDLPDAIKTEQDKMEALVKEIAKSQGPTGIFLPAYPCTKHVNVSMPEWNAELFKYNGNWKQGLHGGRFHVNVGYSFHEYDKLLKAEISPEERWRSDEKPILLGYSMTGDVYVRRSELM